MVNGGFEDENVCTEFHVNCAPAGWINSSDVPYDYYFKNPFLAYEGTHCMAVEAGHANDLSDRTFIRSQLLCKLRKGNIYRVEFYLKSKYPVLDSMGIYFTSYDFLFEKRSPQLIFPSVYVTNGEKWVSKKDSSWRKVVLNYKANGNESFITLGNFSKKFFPLKNNALPGDHVFVFIDDISMIPTDPKEVLCSDWRMVKDDIYNFNIRHQYLRRYIAAHASDLSATPQLSKTLMRVIDTLIVPDVFFETGKSALTKSSHSLLNKLCRRLQGKQIDSIIAEGHTDSIGTVESNQKLSMDRAVSVTNYISQNLSLRYGLFFSRGWASEKPVADNRTSSGRRKNRRVEIFIYMRE